MMIASVTHIRALSSVTRTRMSPYRGTVLVKEGQKVAATDVIVDYPAKDRKHILLDIRKTLGLQDGLEFQYVFNRKLGEKLEKGDVIASTGKIFQKVVTAPETGRIAAISSGRVLFEIESSSGQVLAGISGVVSKVIDDFGAMIEANGALIQGVWGNGRVGEGLLFSFNNSEEEEIQTSHLDISMRGAVLFAGHCADMEVLVKADEFRLRGLILGSMNAELIRTAEAIEVPVILLEGFGKIPINTAAYKILSTNDKRDISINAIKWDRYMGERPEVFIQLPAVGDQFSENLQFEKGQIVKLQGFGLSGKIGELITIQLDPVPLLNGLRVPAGDVRLEDGKTIKVPLANLEIMG
ncbi:MAG: hypothetical protein JEZ06_10130 [Anaerolineaceae bacterium]|nr:hypothetical protein [Anaerolineaceae bacterium]